MDRVGEQQQHPRESRGRLAKVRDEFGAAIATAGTFLICRGVTGDNAASLFAASTVRGMMEPILNGQSEMVIYKGMAKGAVAGLAASFCAENPQVVSQFVDQGMAFAAQRAGEAGETIQNVLGTLGRAALEGGKQIVENKTVQDATKIVGGALGGIYAGIKAEQKIQARERLSQLVDTVQNFSPTEAARRVSANILNKISEMTANAAGSLQPENTEPFVPHDVPAFIDLPDFTERTSAPVRVKKRRDGKHSGPFQ